MGHPLSPDLTSVPDEEFHSKRNELTNRLNYAYRIGSADMVGQLQLLLQDYAMELERRNQKMIDDSQKSNKLTTDHTDRDITG